jgi:tyrosinase
MPSPLSLRKNVEGLSESDLQSLRSGYTKMQAISDNRGFNYLAGYHGVPGRFCHARDILFLPWHRAYLYTLEQALKDQSSAATIPWWDWTSDSSHTKGIPSAFAEATDATGQRNPLMNSLINAPLSTPPTARFTQRSPGDPATLPKSEVVAALLDKPNFIDFSNQLEDLHNHVHQWVGGDMEFTSFAAYDPLFFTHHAMIDRLWYLWQIKNGQNNIPIEILDAVLAPFIFKVADVLDITRLGYDYAATQVVSSGATHG